jgi:hypothetical protein
MTCSSDGSLRVWNLESGKQIGDDWRDGDSEVRTIALSPDGKKVVSGGSVDGAVKLWDIDTGKVITKWMGHTKPVWSVCWSRDGRRVVSGSYDGTAREWDVENGETILGPIETWHEHVEAVVYSPDMTMFATAGSNWLSIPDPDSAIKIWNLQTGELVTTLKGHTNWVYCLAWTQLALISGSVDSSIRKWDTKTWKEIAVLDGHTNAVYAIAISPNGRILASASYDNTARLWNLENGQPISSPLKHTHFVNRVSFSVDGKLLATGCDDHNAYIWDVSAILKEAGLDDLLLGQRDKPLPVVPADATPPPVLQPTLQPIIESPQVSHGFLEDIPNSVHSSAEIRPQPPSHPSHRSTLRSRFLSLLRPIHPDAHNTSSRTCWIRNRLSGKPNGADVELHERYPAIVDIPYYGVERPRPIRKNPAASSSRPPNSTITQQSSGVAQTQSSSQQHAAVSASTTPPVVVHTTSNNKPHATISKAGRWARFWHFICCTSPEYIDGHH